MMKSFEELQKEYTGDGEKSYLILTVPVDCELKQYQISMLEKNRLGLLLPVNIHRVNDDWKLSYDITSRIPLYRVLERKPVKHHEFEFIISQFAALVHELKDYLLDLSSVVLDSTYIFCDPAAFTLFFMYLPMKNPDNEPERIQGFLRKLVVEELHLAEDKSGALLRKLLEALKSDAFTSELLYRCLDSGDRQARGETISSDFFLSKGKDIQFRAADDKEIRADDYRKLQPEKLSSVQTHDTVHHNREQQSIPIPRPGRESHPVQKSTIDKTFKDRQHRENSQPSISIFRKYPKSSWLIAGGVNLLLFGFLIVVIASSGKNPNNTVNNLLGFLLIAGAGNYFLITRLFSKDKWLSSHEIAATVASPPAKRFVNQEMDEDIILPKSRAMRQWEHREKDMMLSGFIDLEKPIKKDSMMSGALYSDVPSFELRTTVFEDDGNTNPDQSVPHNTADLTPSDQNMATPKVNPAATSLQKQNIPDKTMVLGRASQQTPYLICIARPHEKVLIDKDTLLIGRLTDSVDYVIPNRAIGKIHAEIKKIGEHYYITDLNSVNGTYVNDERLVCNIEVQLKNGDRITLANETFTFHG